MDLLVFGRKRVLCRIDHARKLDIRQDIDDTSEAYCCDLYKAAHQSLSFGAANEVRTRDVLLGKQVLYQLSYSRIKTYLYITSWLLSTLLDRHVLLDDS